MGAERRKNPRVVVTDVTARVTVGGETLPGKLQDICRDAALVEVERSFPLQTLMTIEAELPGVKGAIRASGHVIRLAPYDDGRHSVAVLFDDLPKEHQLRIDLFISEQEG
ncbi:MAG TPA: PilZ domain-containing protein [Vicinamibacteria bacterium]|nr:PilZ domain-containing protein [Vicinamibacteria bacterium]